MRILETVDDLEQARRQELHWIQYYASRGVSLTNTQLIRGSIEIMEGLYTASEAREKLGGMAGESLKRLVENGQIRKVIPPGNKKRGLYVKEDVDKLAAAMEQFMEIYSLTEAIMRT